MPLGHCQFERALRQLGPRLESSVFFCFFWSERGSGFFSDASPADENFQEKNTDKPPPLSLSLLLTFFRLEQDADVNRVGERCRRERRGEEERNGEKRAGEDEVFQSRRRHF